MKTFYLRIEREELEIKAKTPEGVEIELNDEWKLVIKVDTENEK